VLTRLNLAMIPIVFIKKDMNRCTGDQRSFAIIKSLRLGIDGGDKETSGGVSPHWRRRLRKWKLRKGDYYRQRSPLSPCLVNDKMSLHHHVFDPACCPARPAKRKQTLCWRGCA